MNIYLKQDQKYGRTREALRRVHTSLLFFPVSLQDTYPRSRLFPIEYKGYRDSIYPASSIFTAVNP